MSQYYTVLHSSPKHLHRFYADNSTLTHADVKFEEGQITQSLKTATGQKMIHETVMNLQLEDTVTEIYSVDSQYSLDGAVVVQVTGALQNQSGLKRSFVQTFFLAVQEKGYYVLNDIFRYLLPSAVISDVEARVVEGAAGRKMGREHGKRSTSPPVAIATPRSPHQQMAQLSTSTLEMREGIHSERENIFQYVESNVSGDVSSQEAKQKPKHVAETVHYSEGGMEKQVSEDSSKKASKDSKEGETDKESHGETEPESETAQEGDAVSSPSLPATEGVFIRDIPAHVTSEELSAALQKFGSLKANSLSVKSMKGRDSYAFVDFTSVESAKACLATGMEFDGKKVSVEPKRPTIFRQGGGGLGRKLSKPNGGHRNAQRMQHVPQVQAYQAMQFPHPHMVLYPSGIGMPVNMGMPMNPAMLPRMHPPPPPPPPSIPNAYVSQGPGARSHKMKFYKQEGNKREEAH